MKKLLLVAGALALVACRTQTTADTDAGAMGVAYQASSVPTAEPRISLWKLDGLNNRCTSVLLVQGNPAMPVTGATLPMGWAIDRAWQVDNATGCTALTPPTGARVAVGASGSISFDNPSAPTTITVHAGLQFPTLGEALDVDNLAITPAM